MRFLGFVGVALASGLDELIGKVYPSDAPSFVRIKGPGEIAVASNDTALLKISELQIDPYPLKSGEINVFDLYHSLAEDLPEDAELFIHAFVNGQQVDQGTLEFCKYLVFARLSCPMEKYPFEVKTIKLQIPDYIKDSKLELVAELRTDKLFANLAAILDIKQDQHTHDEL